MLGLLYNVVRAATAVAVTPVALAVDVVTLPSTAYDNKPAFGNTTAALNEIVKVK